MSRPRVHLRLDAVIPAERAAAIDHAFRTWAATRRLPVTVDPIGADVVLPYGGDDEAALPATDWRLRPTAQRWSDDLPWMYCAGASGGDHLAEVHAWVSGRAEADGPVDGLGRRPPAASTAARLGADPRIAWAGRHLEALDAAVLARRPALARALHRSDPTLTVLGSHDIDFLPTRRGDTVRRVAKNVAVALAGQRDPALAGSITAAAGRQALVRRPLLGGVQPVAELEARLGIRSTWNVLVRSRHRRDAAYRVDDLGPAALLGRLARSGHEIGIHGSYESSAHPGALAEEADLLRRLGHEVAGGRQHWLRHDGVGLWGEVAKADLRYDSSGGWPDEIGFRHGMAEPFVPFDLTTGAPATVMEVPLVVMDVALGALARRGERPDEAVEAVLTEATRHGGAVSVLWHDTVFSDTQLRPGIGGLYERLVMRGDAWRTSIEEVDRRVPAWSAAGLSISAG